MAPLSSVGVLQPCYSSADANIIPGYQYVAVQVLPLLTLQKLMNFVSLANRRGQTSSCLISVIGLGHVKDVDPQVGGPCVWNEAFCLDSSELKAPAVCEH